MSEHIRTFSSRNSTRALVKNEGQKMIKRIFFLVTFNLIFNVSFAQSNSLLENSFRQFLVEVRADSIRNNDWNAEDWDKYTHQELLQLPLKNKETYYKAVRQALTDLGDHHSFLIGTQKTMIKKVNTKQNIPEIVSMRVDEGIGVVTMSSYFDADPFNELFIEQFHRELEKITPLVNKGWIIDLRNNSGGNVYPMIASISDFISNQNVGGCYYYGTNYPEHLLKNSFDGQSFRMNDQLIFSYKKSYPIGTITLPTVVLIGEKTGSSGEGLALTLERQPNVILAGQSTFGLATGNEFMALPDDLGHYMLTICHDLDKNDKPLLSEKVEPAIYLMSDSDQIYEAKKIIMSDSTFQSQ